MSHLQLLDLPVEILFFILRHVPLKDKLHTLSKMPEFRPFLKDRASYLDSSAPFSLKYINLLCRLQPGWYSNWRNAFNRFYLMIDETTLHVTWIEFKLVDILKRHQPNSTVQFYWHTLENFKMWFKVYIRDFEYFEDQENLLTYHLEGYGFIVLHYNPFSTLQKIYLEEVYSYVDWHRDSICLTRSVSASRVCWFQLSLNREKKLVATCRDPKTCQCQDTVQEFDPISLELTADYKYLMWNGGDPIPQWSCYDYRLEKDGYMEGFRLNHHLPFPHKHEPRPIVEEDGKNKHLKKFLWPKPIKRI